MIAHWILLAFGFGNLAMLGWLAAAAAPLLIHLWSRHRFREVPWAAMSFLLAAMRKNARRMQLQQWLLLAVRTLLIVLVVLAVAEPYGEQIGRVRRADAQGARDRWLVLDGLSRGRHDAARGGKARADEIVQQSGPADAFTIIAMAAPPRQIASRELVERRAVRDRIDALAPSDGGANLAATLELVATAMATSADRCHSV